MINASHIMAISRREVREMLSDWRVVTPLLLLTLLLPQLLVVAAGQVVRFVDTEGLAGRLVPFAALLVGFVPASFALIAALESFVGERERNTLESLLAMPLSDVELYLGKLISSLLTPLLSSLTAMLIFVGLMLGLLPELYFESIDPARLALLVLLVIGMALVMVTGAVVISAHITTLRAANLMSSFILVPMAGVMQLAALLIINDRWQQLWLLAAALAVGAAILLRIGMRTFSREELLSREQLQGQLRTGRAMGRALTRAAPRWPVATIARRELSEVLSDWRVLVPFFALTFGLPAVLVAGTNFAISFIENERLLGLLVPFAALLVGFVPASFALITAIESFVGERERNTLESLLAMPISDRQLYSGKLLAALLVPLAGSQAAMLFFLTLIRIFFPTLFAVAISPVLLPLLVLMLAAINLLLVAGAVVISTHTGSVRAATLMASAVLVPTAVTIQLQVLLFIAQRYDVLWYVVAALAVIAVAFIRSGLASFNREEILSREHEELSLERVLRSFGMLLREHRPASTPLSAYAGLRFSPRRFYTRELPALLRELRLPLLCVLVAVVAGTLLGLSLGRGERLPRFAAAFDQLLAGLGNPPAPSPLLAALVFFNNLRVSLLSNVFSAVSFGLFAFLVPFVAFGQIGLVIGRLQLAGGSWLPLSAESPLQFLLAYVAPHGIIELPTFLLSAALGMRIGAALLAPPPGSTVGHNLLWSIAVFFKVWLLVLIPLIALSAAIEGLITPRVVLMLYGG
jgi:uncharacterized membrane protein SpoIIM required for sporulation/ABC-type Na+ efflux pump permease subunit